jgi:hypothetical protein
MAVSPLKNVSIGSPGFLGLNTQDSGINLESGYATVATNCVIDKFGRLGARKGYHLDTTSTPLTSGKEIESLFEFQDIDGSTTILSAGDAKLLKGTTTQTAVSVFAADETTVVTTSFTGNRWQFSSLLEGTGPSAKSLAVAAQRGNPLLVYRRKSGTGDYIFQRVGSGSGYGYGDAPSGVTTFDPDCALSAFGRMWVAGLTSNQSTIYYSALSDPSDFQASGSGILDISTVVGGNDSIVALEQHNNYLIIFCKHNIVIYEGAQSPSTMTLADVVRGVGCVARDSVQATGTDLIFLSNSGVRSFNRTIQEKSMPMRELSLNIRDDLVSFLAVETMNNVRSVYFEEEAFYLLMLPGSRTMIYFDMRSALPNGAARATFWRASDGVIYKAAVNTQDRKLLLGVPDGIAEYKGYRDNNSTYEFEYLTTASDLGGPTANKLLKRAELAVIGSGEQDFTFRYGYDYTLNLNTTTITRDFGVTSLSRFGMTFLYGVAKYSSVGIGIQNIKIPLGGSGKVVQFGINSTIDDEPLSVQKIDVYLKTGKTI